MRWVTLLVALTFLLSSQSVLAGRVTQVHDGDTFTLEGRFTPWSLPVSVRVLDIDTPELWSAKCSEEKEAARRARDFTRNLITAAGNRVSLSQVSWDKYGGRIAAKVTLTVGGRRVDLARELISSGLAVHYTGYGPKMDWCMALWRLPSGSANPTP